MKVHVGCGDVYLKNYINCDVVGTHAKTVQTNPNETTLEKYFKYPFGDQKRQIIIDLQMNAMQQWPFEPRSVTELVTISFIEHFPPQDVDCVLTQVERVLASEGQWIVDFPDISTTVKKYITIDPEFCMRLIYCNHRDQYAVHHWGYTFQTFRDLLLKRGMWKNVQQKTIVKHCYPMIGVVATRK